MLRLDFCHLAANGGVGSCGISAFRRRHGNLCEFNVQSQSSCMYSPTNPDSESSACDIYNTSVSIILPSFLYIGNERDASSLDQLRTLGITKVINVTSHVKCHHQENGVDYCRLSATDCNSQDMRQYFEKAFQFIDEARVSGQRVLVHCHAGVSRSATIVIAYIMKHTALNMHDAYTFVKEQRTIISPNFNFLGQLHHFEQDLLAGRVQRHLLPHLLRPAVPTITVGAAGVVADATETPLPLESKSKTLTVNSLSSTAMMKADPPVDEHVASVPPHIRS